MSGTAHIQSVDGTRIGYRTSGTGPPLVLVHGATADSTVMSLLTPLLERHYTVHAMDRRGRGLSADTPDYDITHEFADVAGIVDDVARQSGRSVSLYGHSYGAVCALGAALLTGHVEQLFLYEPGFGAVLSPRQELLDRLDDLVAAGEYDAALEHFYRQAVGMSVDDVAAMRRQPSWRARLASAPTMPRELRTAAALEFDPAPYRDFATPTVLLLGDRSTPGQKSVVATVDDALPNSIVVPLPGQAHAAQITAPDLVADALVRHGLGSTRMAASYAPESPASGSPARGG
jgi:pimeloyl-ACP methyl ester carboxylesterase